MCRGHVGRGANHSLKLQGLTRLALGLESRVLLDVDSALWSFVLMRAMTKVREAKGPKIQYEHGHHDEFEQLGGRLRVTGFGVGTVCKILS